MLLAMSRSVDLRQCGVNVILNRIIEDMDALYNGVKMQTINGQKTIYGAMVSWSAVTLWHNMNWQGSRRMLALPTVKADTVSVLLRTCSLTSMRMHLLKGP